MRFARGVPGEARACGGRRVLVACLRRRGGVQSGVRCCGGRRCRGAERGAAALMDYFKLKRLMGAELFNCAQEIVIYNCSAPEWARRHGRNPKAATEVMRIAFDALEDAFKNLRGSL